MNAEELKLMFVRIFADPGKDWTSMLKRANKARAVNDRGLLIGEDHPRAVLMDREVELLLELRDGGVSYGKLALKFGVSKSCVAKICRGEHRSQIPVAYRRARGPGTGR